MIKIVVLFVFLILVFVNINCTKRKWFKKVVYEGTVYDSIGGMPSANVQVVLNACNPQDHKSACDGFVAGYSTTDASGHFKIVAKAARSDRYQIQFRNVHIGLYDISSDQLDDIKYSKLYLK